MVKFLLKIKGKLSRGLILSISFYGIFLLILVASNRTNVEADVLILWMLIPAAYLAIVAAIAIEICWSVSAHTAQKKKGV